jgi:CRP-like cAMP-binding protein
MADSSTFSFVPAGRWLGGLEPRTRDIIQTHTKVRQLNDGDVVFRTGEKSDGLYGVIKGQVRLTMTMQTGQLLLNHVADAGEWFGEASTLDGKPRFNDAVCAGPALLAHMSQIDAQRLLKENVGFAHALAVLAARHQRGSMTFAARALSQPVSVQLACALANLARRTSRGPKGATIPLRQEDLANLVGVSRQTVAPLLRNLQIRGIIRLGYGYVEVLDRPALEREAGRPRL